MSAAAWVARAQMQRVLNLMQEDNRLVCEVMLKTGLRVGDVLQLRCEKLRARITVREMKTGKRRSIYLGLKLARKLRRGRRRGWVFPSPRDSQKHRSRQAVWVDMKKAAELVGVRGVSPHSCRKIFAVEYRKRYGIAAAQRVLNHDNRSVTVLYALSDVLSKEQ